MVQTGDPSGSGKGGQSIYGQPFADEIRSTLKVRNLLHSPGLAVRLCRPDRPVIDNVDISIVNVYPF